MLGLSAAGADEDSISCMDVPEYISLRDELLRPGQLFYIQILGIFLRSRNPLSKRSPLARSIAIVF